MSKFRMGRPGWISYDRFMEQPGCLTLSAVKTFPEPQQKSARGFVVLGNVAGTTQHVETQGSMKNLFPRSLFDCSSLKQKTI